MNKTFKQILDCFKLAVASLNKGVKEADISLLGLLAMTVDMSQHPQSSVTHVGLGAAPDLNEFDGAVKYKRLTGKEYTIKDKLWTSGIEVDRSTIENDAIGLFLNKAQDLGTNAKTHPVRLLLKMLIAGESATYGLAYDGADFFSDSHAGPKVDGTQTTQSNLVTRALGTGAAYTLEMFEADFNALLAQMQTLKDEDDGEAFFGATISYDQLTVFVPAKYRSMAQKLFASKTLNNDDNPYLGVNVQISPQITDDSWYMVYTGSSQKAFIYQPMTDVEVTSNMNGTQDSVMDLELYHFKARRRYNNGYAFWQMAAKVKITRS